LSKTSKNEQKIAVIDIGSNSIRLVIFDRYGRYPYPLFNERITCRLGADLKKTKMLRVDRIEHALLTIKRFSNIIKSAKLRNVHAIATAAAREAKNADEFLIPAEKLLGFKIKVLSGDQEANLVADGLLSNIPDASGVIADLGGGSVELIRVQSGLVCNTASLNFGHLSDLSEQKIISELKKLNWLQMKSNEFFYGVGGSFRALGLVYKHKRKYPIDLLHGLTIPVKRTKRIFKKILEKGVILKGLPSSRKDSMPNAARIMKIILQESKAKNLIICGTSVRDGVVLETIPDSNGINDPLLLTCKEIANQTQRFRGTSTNLEKLLKPLIKIGSKKSLKRLLKAVTLLSDICWNEHTDSRAFLAAERVLLLPINSITHRERAWLAEALFYRYGRQFELQKFPFKFSQILSYKDQLEARTIGLSLRFAMTFSAGLPEHLKNIKIKMDKQSLNIIFSGDAKEMFADHIRSRLQLMSYALERELVINFQ
tara:strand:- start:492 stop:1943 length:1452 start_codon:yes stop_codon:yes gene_type:complete